jgi:hypothetical protein
VLAGTTSSSEAPGWITARGPLGAKRPLPSDTDADYLVTAIEGLQCFEPFRVAHSLQQFWSGGRVLNS